MLPEFFFFRFSFKTYALFYLLGFYAASMVLVVTRRGKGKSIRESVALSLYLLAGVFVFGKLAYIALHFKDFLALRQSVGLSTAFKQEGLIAQGGLLGGLLVVLLVSKYTKESFWQISDNAAPAVALGQGIGRIGCFLAGCCRGTETHSIMGVIFPDEMNSLTQRHPVQLYESFFLVTLFFFLVEWRHRAKFEGEVALLYLILASSIRFLMEYFRWGVSAQVMWGVITQAQVVCMLVIIFALFKMKRWSHVSLKMGM